MRNNKTNTLTMLLIALTLAASGDSLANDDGTWHGGTSATVQTFCGMLGYVAGAEVQDSCLALL